MIDEEKAKREEDAKMTVDQKIILLKEHVKGIKTRFDRLKKDYSSFSHTCSDKLHSIHSNIKQWWYNRLLSNVVFNISPWTSKRWESGYCCKAGHLAYIRDVTAAEYITNFQHLINWFDGGVKHVFNN